MAVTTIRSHTINDNTKAEINPITKKKLFLSKNGYIKAGELCKTLQGSMWLAYDKSSQMDVAIKIAIRDLVNTSTARHKEKKIKISEDIKSEALLLKLISSDQKCPKSITKFVNFFKRYTIYIICYIMMTT